MRDLAELRMDHPYGGPFPPPSDQLIADFEREWGIRLPASYISFLKQYNGGYSELEPRGDYGIDAIFHLSDAGDSGYQLQGCKRTLSYRFERWQIPFADSSVGNYYFMDLSFEPERIMIFRPHFPDSPVLIANSFEQFIDEFEEYVEE